MRPLSYAGYRFPPEIIQHAVWLYLRFTLSFRDVEELLAERSIDVSHETIRRWVEVFGPVIARPLRAMRPKPHTTWHLDEMFISVGGKMMYSVARRRCRRRSARLSGPITPKQAGSAAPDAQAHPQVSHDPCQDGDRQTA